MIKKRIETFLDYLSEVEQNRNDNYHIHLFRGQSHSQPLLPSIARVNPSFDTTKIEIKMLEDLKRRSPLLVAKSPTTDWQWLVFAQHFSLKTRLLDWASNPLIALWFACSNEYVLDKNSYVYELSANEEMLVDVTQTDSPFSNTKTRILRPTLNNERIVAQSGWFTAHKFSRGQNRFIELEARREERFKIVEIEIPAKSKKDILKTLSNLGVNYRTVFPDVEGLCLHLNWKYQSEIPQRK
jgi:hypothetical protein